MCELTFSIFLTSRGPRGHRHIPKVPGLDGIVGRFDLSSFSTVDTLDLTTINMEPTAHVCRQVESMVDRRCLLVLLCIAMYCIYCMFLPVLRNVCLPLLFSFSFSEGPELSKGKGTGIPPVERALRARLFLTFVFLWFIDAL